MMRSAAAEALDNLGWEPGSDKDKACYCVARQDWEQCVALGEQAVGSLGTAFWDEDEKVSKAAIETLGQIGGARAMDLLGTALGNSNWKVRSWAARSLERVGDARAVQLLCLTLKDSDQYVRKTAAEALVKLFRQGNLNDEQKQQLLTLRECITRQHVDKVRHSDEAAQRGHSDTTCFTGNHVDLRSHPHQDNPHAHYDGTESSGIDFPL